MDEARGGGRRVAFFGGSFDPPHVGHLAVARAACGALRLDAVLFAPVGAQPLKPGGAAASFEDRLAMTRLAVGQDARFEVCLADAPRASGLPNYTLETLRGLRSQMEQGGALFCLMGADAFVGLRSWHGAAEIPFVAPLIVASRPGEPLDRLEAALPDGLALEAADDGAAPESGVTVRCFDLRNSAGKRTSFYLLPGLDVDVSASEIRRQVRGAGGGGRQGEALVPGAVGEYIREHRLYR